MHLIFRLYNSMYNILIIVIYNLIYLKKNYNLIIKILLVRRKWVEQKKAV